MCRKRRWCISGARKLRGSIHSTGKLGSGVLVGSSARQFGASFQFRSSVRIGSNVPIGECVGIRVRFRGSIVRRHGSGRRSAQRRRVSFDQHVALLGLARAP